MLYYFDNISDTVIVLNNTIVIRIVSTTENHSVVVDVDVTSIHTIVVSQ